MESPPNIELKNPITIPLRPKVESTVFTPPRTAQEKSDGNARAYLTEMAKQIPKVTEGSLTQTAFQSFVHEIKHAGVPEDQIAATLETNGVKVIRTGEGNVVNEQEMKLNLDKLESDLLLQEQQGGAVPTTEYPDAKTPVRFTQGGTRPEGEELWWKGGRVDDENEDQLLEELKQRARKITSSINGFGDAASAIDRMTFLSSGERPGGMGSILSDDHGNITGFWINQDAWRLTAPELDRLLVHELLHAHDLKKTQSEVWTHSASEGSWINYRWLKRAESVFTALQKM